MESVFHGLSPFILEEQSRQSLSRRLQTILETLPGKDLHATLTVLNQHGWRDGDFTRQLDLFQLREDVANKLSESEPIEAFRLKSRNILQFKKVGHKFTEGQLQNLMSNYAQVCLIHASRKGIATDGFKKVLRHSNWSSFHHAYTSAPDLRALHL